MRYSPILCCVLVFLCSFNVLAGDLRSYERWEELPPIDSVHRDSLLSDLVARGVAEWDVNAGGIAPAPGQEPSFRASAGMLAAFWLDGSPSDLVEWTRDVLDKMSRSQVRDSSSRLFGSVIYPGWRDPDQWPVAPDQYRWDVRLPAPLIALYLDHGDDMPVECREMLREMIGYFSDGALEVFSAEIETDLNDMQTHTALCWAVTLELGGEISGNTEAVQAGRTLLETMIADIRRRGIAEYASPEWAALDLDLLALLASKSENARLRRDMLNLYLYVSLDSVLTLVEGDDGDTSFGGPSSWNQNPLNPGGDTLSWLYLVGINNLAPAIDPASGFRLGLDRRPPDVILHRAREQSREEFAACWGDGPGKDRSWLRQSGALVGVSSATSGIVDRQLAIDLPLDVARVHLAADRGTGNGGLPEGEGTGHNPMLIAAVRKDLSIAGVGEIYPFDPEERVTPMLYLPIGDRDPLSPVGRLSLPPLGEEKEWIINSGDWIAVSVDSWWIVAAFYDMGPDNLRLRCPAEEVQGHRVLRMEIHPLYQGQAVLAGMFATLVSKQEAPDVSDLEDLIADTGFSYHMTAAGPELSAIGGLVSGELSVVYDVRANQPAERDPEPGVSCTGMGPLTGPGLSWDARGLCVETGNDTLLIMLPLNPGPREAEGRAS